MEVSKFIPIPELPTTFDEGNRLAWQFGPSANVDQSAIGVNREGIERIVKMAGFCGLNVKTYYGDQSSYSTEGIQLTGTGLDGSATGSADVAITKAATEKSSFADNDDESRLFPEYRWPQLTVELNRNELAPRIAALISGGMGQEAAWAQELNRSLFRGILSGAFNKFRENVSNSKYFQPFDMLSLPASEALMLYCNNYAFAGIIPVASHIYATIRAGRYNLKHTGHNQLHKKRLSIFYGSAQPDRFLAAAAMLATQTLVKPLRQK